MTSSKVYLQDLHQEHSYSVSTGEGKHEITPMETDSSTSDRLDTMFPQEAVPEPGKLLSPKRSSSRINGTRENDPKPAPRSPPIMSRLTAASAASRSSRPKKKSWRALEMEQSSLRNPVKATVTPAKKGQQRKEQPALKSTPSPAPAQKVVEKPEKEYFEVERIIKQKKTGRKIRYLVKWLGYDETTWEPRNNLGTFCPALDEFRKAQGKSTTKEIGAKKGSIASIADTESTAPSETSLFTTVMQDAASLPSQAESNNTENGDYDNDSDATESVVHDAANISGHSFEEDNNCSVNHLMCTEQFGEALAEKPAQMKKSSSIDPARAKATAPKPNFSRATKTVKVPDTSKRKALKSKAVVNGGKTENGRATSQSSADARSFSPEIAVPRARRPSLWKTIESFTAVSKTKRARPVTASAARSTKQDKSSALDDDAPFVNMRISNTDLTARRKLLTQAQGTKTFSLTSVIVKDATTNTQGIPNSDVQSWIPVAKTSLSGLASGALVVGISGFKPRELAIHSLNDVSFLVTYADRDAEFVDYEECIQYIPHEVATFLFHNKIHCVDAEPLKSPGTYQ